MINGSTYKLLLAAAFLAIAGFLGAIIGSALVQPEAEARTDVRHFLESQLMLSDDQRRELDTLDTRYRLAMREHETALQAANNHLARVFVEQRTLTPEVESAVERIHHDMGNLQKVTMRYLYEVRGVLDEEQARQFDRFVTDTLHGDRDHQQSQ